jgi:benzodiazapine receptor
MGKLAGLLGWVVVTFTAAAIGSIASVRAPEFYSQLSRPDWAPPSSVFGPVWTLLYVLMAIAAFLVWRERGFRVARFALGIYLLQLAANALWSWLFFGWQQGNAAAVEVVVLLLLIIVTVVAFWRIRPLAGALLLPYLAWVSYATALTISIVRRNPQLL